MHLQCVLSGNAEKLICEPQRSQSMFIFSDKVKTLCTIVVGIVKNISKWVNLLPKLYDCMRTYLHPIQLNNQPWKLDEL